MSEILQSKSLDKVLIIAFVVVSVVGIASNANHFFMAFGVAAWLRVVFKMAFREQSV